MSARAVRFWVALSIAVSLAACGGSRVAASPSHTATGAKPPGGARTQRSRRSASAARARARAFASAVNLRAQDVPGFGVSSEKRKPTSAAEALLERELHRCLGASTSASALAEASSPELTRKGELTRASVSSAVTVQASAAAATRALAAYRSGRLRACLSHYFQELLAQDRPHGARVGAVRVQHGTPPAQGTSGGFALRFSATVTVDHLPVPFYVDVLGFVDRAATVSLLSTSIPAPFPPRIEERLFSLLLERARAHNP